jgi:hypothetical protein
MAAAAGFTGATAQLGAQTPPSQTPMMEHSNPNQPGRGKVFALTFDKEMSS